MKKNINIEKLLRKCNFDILSKLSEQADDTKVYAYSLDDDHTMVVTKNVKDKLELRYYEALVYKYYLKHKDENFEIKIDSKEYETTDEAIDLLIPDKNFKKQIKKSDKNLSKKYEVPEWVIEKKKIKTLYDLTV